MWLNNFSGVCLCLQRRRTCFRTCCHRWQSSSAGNTSVVCVMLWLKPAPPQCSTCLTLNLLAAHGVKLNPKSAFTFSYLSFILPIYIPLLFCLCAQWTMWSTNHSPIILYSYDLFFSHRAFRINELKTEVTNRLAMLEKRVERECHTEYQKGNLF